MSGRYGAYPLAALQDVGYVYLMSASDGTFKIGVSSDPESRCATIAKARRIDMTIMGVLYCDKPLELERKLRDKYRPVKVFKMQDWFHLTPAHITEILDMMQDAGGEVYFEPTEPKQANPEAHLHQRIRAALIHIDKGLSIAEYMDDQEAIPALQAAKFALSEIMSLNPDTITRKANQQQGE